MLPVNQVTSNPGSENFMMTQREEHVRVRFAPSPTGYLHVGGARTAIFNWLFARQHQGKFLVRIEDTDVERSAPEMVENILESLRWLGMESDEPVVYQSRNLDKHQQAIQLLLESGDAYRCFCTPEELEEKKREMGEEYQYDQTCRNLSKERIADYIRRNTPYAVRFQVPEGWVNFKDQVYKRISVQSTEIDDFIIQRRDGTPVYQLAVVVDDASMEITHVIRGEDHLSNTPKQILLYKALGYPVPKFVHLPLILGSDGGRLSKRHGATSVDEYRQRGYLNTAVFNYLSLLGWTPKGNQEVFMPEELISQFDLARVSKSSALFDEQKLYWISDQHFSRWATEDLVPLADAELRKAGLIDDPEAQRSYTRQVTELLKTRLKLTSEIVKFGRYFWEDPGEYDQEAVARFWPDENVNNLMKKWVKRLESLEDFNKERIEKELRDLAKQLGVKAAELIHPTRIALTGFGVSPGIFEVMSLLGKRTNVRRLCRAIRSLPQPGEVTSTNVE